MTHVQYPATALGRASPGEQDASAGHRLEQPGGDADGADPSGAEFRELMRHWPTGVSIITTQDADSPAGCTASSVMCVSLNPPLLVIALAADSTTLGAIGRTGTFGVNVLGSDQGDLGQRFACGDHRDRFRGVDCWYQGQLPLLPEVVACVVCDVCETALCGDHVLVIGRPVWLMAEQDRSPLVRFRSDYRRLAEAPGNGGRREAWRS